MEKIVPTKKYFSDALKDIKELKMHYPFVKYLSPLFVLSHLNKPITLKVIAVNKDIIDQTRGVHTDFVNKFSKEIIVEVPENYKKEGCKIYGGSWFKTSLINNDDIHYYATSKYNLHEFCLGVPASFKSMNNVILENVKTAECMLYAYEQIQRGETEILTLYAFPHGKEGEKKYERKKSKRKHKKSN